jgi:hypothetical protein
LQVAPSQYKRMRGQIGGIVFGRSLRLDIHM